MHGGDGVTNLKNSRFVIPLVIATCIPIALLVNWFAQPKKEAKQRMVMVWIDISDQSKETILLNSGMAFQSQRHCSSGTRVRAYVFAHNFDVIYAGSSITSKGQFNQVIGQRLDKPSAELGVPDTQTDLVLHEIASCDFGIPREAVLVTDAGIENLTPKMVERIRSDVQRMAADHQFVRLTVVGALQEHRKRWESWLKPLGSRAVVRGRSDFKEVLDQVGR